MAWGSSHQDLVAAVLKTFESEKLTVEDAIATALTICAAVCESENLKFEPLINGKSVFETYTTPQDKNIN